jgi:tetratricopeptide (TPR) repeat protein
VKINRAKLAQSSLCIFSFLLIPPCFCAEDADSVSKSDETVSTKKENELKPNADIKETFDQAQELVKQGKLAEADFLFKKVLDHRKTVLGPTDWTKEAMAALEHRAITLPILLEMRQMFRLANEAAKSQPVDLKYRYINDAKSLSRNVDSEQPHLFRKTANLRLDGYAERPNYAECEALVKLDLMMFEIDPDRDEAAKSLGTLGQIYFMEKKYALSTEMFKQAAKLYETADGKASSNYLACCNNIAINNLKQRKYAESEAQLKDSLAIIEQSKSDYLVNEEVMLLSSLRDLYNVQRRTEDAELAAKRLAQSRARLKR